MLGGSRGTLGTLTILFRRSLTARAGLVGPGVAVTVAVPIASVAAITAAATIAVAAITAAAIAAIAPAALGRTAVPRGPAASVAALSFVAARAVGRGRCSRLSLGGCGRLSGQQALEARPEARLRLAWLLGSWGLRSARNRCRGGCAHWR